MACRTGTGSLKSRSGLNHSRRELSLVHWNQNFTAGEEDTKFCLQAAPSPGYREQTAADDVIKGSFHTCDSLNLPLLTLLLVPSNQAVSMTTKVT